MAHAVFMVYGKKEFVDMFLRDLAAQKLSMVYHKKGEPDKTMFIECQLRVLPFGLYEFVFPKEHMDLVLTGLRFHMPSGIYNLDQEITKFGFTIKPLDHLRKFLKIEPVPEFKTDKALLFTYQHIAVIPIGVRYDGEITEPEGCANPGWTHEAI